MKRACAEDFFDSSDKTKKSKDDHGSDSGKESPKEDSKKRDKDTGKYKDKYESKRSRRYDDRDRSRSPRDRYSQRKSRPYSKPQVTSRYWEGDKRRLEDEADESRSRYVVGTRYYSDSKDKPDKNRSPKGGSPRSRSPSPRSPRKVTQDDAKIKPLSVQKTVDILTSKTGGAYIPPGKLRLMQASITDKSSAAYQRIAWEALKKSIHGHINKVNTANIGVVARLLFKENIVRGRGLLTRSIIQAQAASPTFTNVYAALVSVINSRFPNIGELLIKRLVITFMRCYKRNDKAGCLAAVQFIAHLVNQRVAHEILALEILTLLIENPTEDSIEVAVGFLKEVGQKLTEVLPKGANGIFDMLRNILHEGKLETRVQYMIEVMFQVRKDEFKSFPALVDELDLVEEEDQITHLITLDDAKDGGQDLLNVFKFDETYTENEDKYKQLKAEILDEDSDEGEEADDESGEESDSDEDESGDEEKKVTVVDNTETNLIALRKTIYLTIQSSLDFEECAHKLLKMEVKPGQEVELCHMMLDCCAEQRTYEKFFGLLAQRFCQINKLYIEPFESIFKDSYSTVHRLDTNKLRNVAKFFAHLFYTDAISWNVLSIIKLNEEDTTSSSRIFIKILFQELSEFMGLGNLNQRCKDPTLQAAMDGLFPRDHPKNTRFAINFFTSIGLGGLTDELREHLKTVPKPSSTVNQLIQQLSSSSSSDSDSSSSSSSESSSESDSSDSSDASKKGAKKINKKIDSNSKKARKDESKGDANKKKDLKINDKKKDLKINDKKKDLKINDKNKDLKINEKRNKSVEKSSYRKQRSEAEWKVPKREPKSSDDENTAAERRRHTRDDSRREDPRREVDREVRIKRERRSSVEDQRSHRYKRDNVTDSRFDVRRSGYDQRADSGVQRKSTSDKISDRKHRHESHRKPVEQQPSDTREKSNKDSKRKNAPSKTVKKPSRASSSSESESSDESSEDSDSDSDSSDNKSKRKPKVKSSPRKVLKEPDSNITPPRKSNNDTYYNRLNEKREKLRASEYSKEVSSEKTRTMPEKEPSYKDRRKHSDKHR